MGWSRGTQGDRRGAYRLVVGRPDGKLTLGRRRRSWEGNIKIAIYIQSNEIHNVVAIIKCLLVLRCQLYLFRTVTVHPQKLLFRYCMCRLWYVVRNALPDTSSWYKVLGRMSN